MGSSRGSHSIRSKIGIDLEPRIEDALGHPLRREILRTLNVDGRARGLPALAAELSPFTASEVSYHVLVLREAGLIVSDSSVAAPSGRQRAYRAAIAESASALAVLRANEQPDRELLRLGSQRSSSRLLSMFRAPRPMHSIRLSARRRRDPGQPG
jgi:DNA-binding transcriptional ArsR family regulator